ncbi:TPA: hypothetical protein SOL98_002805 [Clostridioides difficile]|uniref:Phage protein n=1 Tax=Clostridioides difficile TaxID=1496 RepID=A0AB74QFZ9_CLODI|nr:hypothetical protein [Clostridioides difficile]AYD22739.1 hypothetical protein DA434_16295 [Clostridioides difficile]EGT3903846.1 hypothetical protein [Clostridioides difficile]EGT3942699.1 hypothetical protein [Clostridioides difficile]EGT4099276.1 hypothetical protein [Clostridioides difficile]EGT4248446.1 hypothetical protein [Clostridioides difficile]
MSKKNYLSYEDQFKKNLNQEEISRIENVEIRNIRAKYWNLMKEVFLAEHNISDEDLEKETNKIHLAEQKELEIYKKRDSIE